MMVVSKVRYAPAAWFAGLCLLMVGVEWLVVRRPDFGSQPLLPAAVSFDVLVGVPVLFYFSVVRPYRLPLAAVAGAFGAALALSYWLLPAGQQQYLGWAQVGLVVAEGAVLGWGLLNLRRLVRSFRQARAAHSGYPEALATAVQMVFGRPLGALVMEVSVVYYALLSWRARPEAHTTDTIFTTHQSAAFTAFMSTIAFVFVAEMGALHVLLMRWQPLVAWAALVLHLYGLLVLVAHVRAVHLRPVLLTASGLLVLRTGFLWQLQVPLKNISHVDVLPEAPAPAAGLLNIARPLLTPPNLLLTLAEPQAATGPYGGSRTVRQVALHLDCPANFRAAVTGPASAPNSPVFGNKL